MPPTLRHSRRRTAQRHSARPGTWSGSTRHRRSISRLARSFTARPRPAASPAERRLKRRGLVRARGTERELSLAHYLTLTPRKPRFCYLSRFFFAASECPRKHFALLFRCRNTPETRGQFW